ncbi:DUF1772 domain-containing protein [Modestobacter muralis]|uniref:DUF1772 domain-containing protein n=1 Tax=Modestobacter muralis TaxID=1608614 RepID=A0A6P0EZC4_9ACTN|nr:DUF1772 domain-containing protein [Modestobacter muralis]NEN53138.1 DUF1772 domain-containing protein [Modestobacter muralis]
MTSGLAVAHVLLVGGYAGFQWTVRVLVYPQFTAVPAAASAAYEASHSRRISRVVGPLFAGQLVTTAWLLLDRPHGVRAAGVVVSAACLAAVLLATALLAVPRHRQLAGGFDPAAYAGLLRADTLRVAAATVNVAASAWAVLG